MSTFEELNAEATPGEASRAEGGKSHAIIESMLWYPARGSSTPQGSAQNDMLITLRMNAVTRLQIHPKTALS